MRECERRVRGLLLDRPSHTVEWALPIDVAIRGGPRSDYRDGVSVNLSLALMNSTQTPYQQFKPPAAVYPEPHQVIPDPDSPHAGIVVVITRITIPVIVLDIALAIATTTTTTTTTW